MTEPKLQLIIENADPNTVISGFVITGGVGYHAGGIKCINGSPTFKNCLIIGNTTIDDPFGAGGALCVDSNAVFENCTFADNIGGEEGSGIYCVNSHPVFHNTIIWNNLPQNIILDEYSDPNVSFCNIQGGWPLPDSMSDPNEYVGIIDVDPLFMNPGIWEEGIWIDFDLDYRLMEDSPCIDMGDPNTPVGLEPLPNGNLINLGAYGGTVKATTSPPMP